MNKTKKRMISVVALVFIILFVGLAAAEFGLFVQEPGYFGDIETETRHSGSNTTTSNENPVNVGDDFWLSVGWTNCTNNASWILVDTDWTFPNCRPLTTTGCLVSSTYDIYNCNQLHTFNATALASHGSSNDYFVRVYSQDNITYDEISAFVVLNEGFYVNHPPYASNVRIYTNNGELAIYNNTNKTSILYCNYTFNDQNNDDEGPGASFNWYSDYNAPPGDSETGNPVQLNGTPVILPGLSANKSSRVNCSVAVVDEHGFADSDFIFSPDLIVGNARPFAENVTLIGIYQNMTNNDLNCTYDYLDLDNDPEAQAQFRWYKNGYLQIYTSQTVSHTKTNTGENWTCYVIPYDGEDYGNAYESNILFIANTIPTATVEDYSDDINMTDIINVGETITFYVNWSDLDREATDG